MMKELLRRLFVRRVHNLPLKEQQESANATKAETDDNPTSCSDPPPSTAPSGQPETGHSNGAEIKPQSELIKESASAAEKTVPRGQVVQDLINKKRKERGLAPLRGIPDRSGEIEQGHELLYSGYFRFVVLRPDNVAVKFGSRLNLDEVDAIQFAKDAGIPVAGVIKYGRQESGRRYQYIEMEYVKGDTLQAVWNDLSYKQQLDIAHQLRDIIKTMRSLPPPPDFIGGINSDRIFDPRGMDTFIFPACSTEEEFINLLTDEKREQRMLDPIRKAFRRGIGNNHKIVFTHGDIAPRNIIVRDNRIVALIDWEGAGWYPEYWDYVQFTAIESRCPGWTLLLDEIFPQSYHDELLLFTGMRLYQEQFDKNPYQSKKGRNQEFL